MPVSCLCVHVLYPISIFTSLILRDEITQLSGFRTSAPAGIEFLRHFVQPSRPLSGPAEGRDRTFRLAQGLGKRPSIGSSSLPRDHWNVPVADAVPVRFDLQFIRAWLIRCFRVRTIVDQGSAALCRQGRDFHWQDLLSGDEVCLGALCFLDFGRRVQRSNRRTPR
jgi:hypothetical protein